jgi:hypothetical protein
VRKNRPGRKLSFRGAIMGLRTQKLRSGLLLALIAAQPIASRAAKRVTVAQLTQTLTANVGAHKPDAEIARQIAGLELSERLTEATLARLAATLSADPESALALHLLAEQSAFLDPPASELPPTPSPDDATQQRVLAAARTYVAQTLPRLPNLLATQTTNRYDDSPQETKTGGWPLRAGLHPVDTSSREISVYEETANRSATVASARWQEQVGLTSGGEFASTLGMIMTDTLKGKVTWSHWEQTATGQAAVFHYSVPRSASHFEVIGSLQRQAALEGSPGQIGNSRVSGIEVKPSANSKSSTFVTRLGYRGSFSLDPATGSILRVTVEVDSKESVPFQRAAILVQYGPVQIGDSEFICPVRSAALSTAISGANLDPLTRVPGNAPTQWLNESEFAGYHRFGSTVRVVPGAPAPQ